MANKRNGNTYYIDTAFSTSEELVATGLKATHVVVTSTADFARVVLGDSSVGTKVDLRVADLGKSEVFDFSENPITFSTSIRASTLTNAVVTVVLEQN
jgi:hypothetical protein